MTTAKPRYVGDGAGKLPRDFTYALKSILQTYYPQQAPIACPHFGQPADVFVNEVLAAARPSIAELMWLTMDLTKQELRAEQVDILNCLKTARNKLRTLSTPLSVLLDIEADPLEAADNLDALICQMEPNVLKIDELPKKRLKGGKHDIAVEMTICVSRVLNTYGICISATHSSYTRMADITDSAYDGNDVSQYTSDAVKILKAIGDDIGLKFVEPTWRDIIIEAKSIDPDIQ
jgi:hypothetical protein